MFATKTRELFKIEKLHKFVLQTSFTSLWTLYLLARNPDVQKQLHDEVSSVLKPGERATPAALQKMPFLRGCIKETLRYQGCLMKTSRFLSNGTQCHASLFPERKHFVVYLDIVGK